jgi:hypothetical protein
MFPCVKTLKWVVQLAMGERWPHLSLRGLGAEIEFQLHLYPAVAFLNFRKVTYRLANVPRGVTLYESHLSEVTGLGTGAATREHPESNGSNC